MSEDDELDEDEQPRPVWDIRREGRAWGGGEAHPRYELTPEKIEMIDGKLFWTDEERLTMLGLLLENVGMDAAVRLGDARLWREAVADLPEPEAEPPETR
jgi:hypothetical protein